MAIHKHQMASQSSPVCPYCNTKLMLRYFLTECTQYTCKHVLHCVCGNLRNIWHSTPIPTRGEHFKDADFKKYEITIFVYLFSVHLNKLLLKFA